MARVFNGPGALIKEKVAPTPDPDYGLFYEGKMRVRHIDIDGTVLKVQYINPGDEIIYPEAPNYDPEYLIFDSWSFEEYSYGAPIDIAPVYSTADDYTYIFIRTLTQIPITLNVENYISIDWGDGTINTSLTHTYSSSGIRDYVIKIKPADGYSSNNALLGSYNYMIQKAYMSPGMQGGPSMFDGAHQMTVLSMQPPTGYIYNKSRFFSNCSSLKMVLISSSAIPNDCFTGCRSLQYICTVGQYIDTLGTAAFNGCSAIKELFLNIDSLNYGVLTSTLNLKEICFGYYILPTLGANTPLNAILKNTTIYVRQSAYDLIESGSAPQAWIDRQNQMKVSPEII